MNQRCVPRVTCIAACVLTMAVLLGCGDDSPTVPRNDVEPSFDNIWPAAVGNHWTYDVTTYPIAGVDTLYVSAADVPPIPSMEDLYAALGATQADADAPLERGTFHLRFSEDISPNAETLAMRMANETVDISGSPYPPSPLWLGLAWFRTATRILYSIGSVGWVHLDGSLAPGHEFSVEIPSIVATELATRVWRTREYSALGTEYGNCIECFYVLDAGVHRVGTAYETQGYYREYGYGVIVYAPELGPVYCHEMIMMGRGLWDNREATISGFANETP